MNSWLYGRTPPWNKPDLVKWAIRRFPDSPKTKFHKMKVSQLWAIFFSDRRKKFNRLYNKESGIKG